MLWMAAAIVVGVHPAHPPEGAFKGQSATLIAEKLRSMGVTMAGGTFPDGAMPGALRKAGLRTYGLVVLFQGEGHWKSHPESRPIMADDRPLFKDRWYAGVCPNQDWLRKSKLAEIEKMIASGWYDVINLDFIRYPVHWEVPSPRIPDTCYCAVCLRKFTADTGIEVPRNAGKAAWIVQHSDATWRKWRAAQITGFCAEVKRLRDRIRPSVQIALAAVPWTPEDYSNAIYRIVGQDFKALAGVIDVFQPMSYHVLNGRPANWIGGVNEYLTRETGKLVWPFVIFDAAHPLDRAGWREVFDQALSRGTTGLVAFPFPKMTGPGLDVFVERFAR